MGTVEKKKPIMVILKRICYQATIKIDTVQRLYMDLTYYEKHFIDPIRQK